MTNVQIILKSHLAMQHLRDAFSYTLNPFKYT